jgi:hypothetical protein
VEVFFSDRLERCQVVDACVVDQDVELAERGLRFGEHTVTVRLLRDVRLNLDCLPAAAGYFGDYLVCARLAGGVVDDHGSAFGREIYGDGCSDAFGCACDDSDLPPSLLVFVDTMILFCGFVENGDLPRPLENIDAEAPGLPCAKLLLYDRQILNSVDIVLIYLLELNSINENLLSRTEISSGEQ